MRFQTVKKLFISLVMCAAAQWLVFATSTWASPGFIALFTTDAFGGTTPKTIFAPDETPYLYINLTIPGGATANVVSAWTDPDGGSHFSNSSLSTDTQRWLFLADWPTVRQSGDWSIQANYFDSFGNNAVASTAFTVTPEPATIGLFFLGTVSLFFKRKQGESSCAKNSV